MKKIIPHGQSNYKNLILGNFYYVDRTMYLEKLEEIPNRFQFLLRPRKFGKSLFVSMMQYYYGVEHKDKFSQLFGDYYIGKSPTALANSYYVMMFDFSGITTYDETQIVESFRNSIYSSIQTFNSIYKLFDHQRMQDLESISNPADLMKDFLSGIDSNNSFPIYIVIDEYDHFTNELLSFNIGLFKTSVSQNGFVRKFFEVIKTFTGTGLVKRLFATGVTPVTLDSMTSGFNIAVDLSGIHQFNGMLGFSDAEVHTLLQYYEIENSELVLADMRRYYNGSRFSLKADEKLYNSNMVLYFLFHMLNSGEYPNPIVDKNIVSDYSKISAIFSLNTSSETQDKLNGLLENGEVLAELTQQFTFQREFTTSDLISLLYYNGLLTIRGSKYDRVLFVIPNYVVEELYWKYFAELLRVRTVPALYTVESIFDALEQMADEGKIDKWVELISNTLAHLSNRDLQKFDEKYIKMIMLAFGHLSTRFFIANEREVNRKYPDLMFLRNPQFNVKHQLLIELKYIKIGDKHLLEQTVAKAVEQVTGYLQLPAIKNLDNLSAYAVVFVGEVGQWSEVRGK